MNSRWNYRRIRVWPLAAVAAALLAAGCGPEAKIRKYTVPKLAVSSSQPVKPAEGQPQSILGAIVLAGPKAWFFKVTGEPDVVARHRDEVKAFVRTVRFSSDGERPRWELPEGWKEKKSSISLRLATLEIGGSTPPLDLAVSDLTRDETDEQEFVLRNVNRWRGQVSLPPTTGENLAKEVEQFTIGEFSCTWVELTGTSGGAMGGPFAGGPFAGGGLPPDHPAVESASGGPSTPSRAEPAKPTYEVPEGWKELAPNSFRQASFEVSADGQKADVSVTSLSLRAPNAGDLAANVNRWRRLVGLAEQSGEEAAKSASEVQGRDLTWKVVHIVGHDGNGEPEAILAAMTTTADAAWFVKLTGPPPLAESQKQHFEQFVKSLKIESQ